MFLGNTSSQQNISTCPFVGFNEVLVIGQLVNLYKHFKDVL